MTNPKKVQYVIIVSCKKITSVYVCHSYQEAKEDSDKLINKLQSQQEDFTITIAKVIMHKKFEENISQ